MNGRIIVPGIFIVVFSFVFGFAAGQARATYNMYHSAVKAGVGEFIIVNTDQAKFRWKKCQTE